MNDELFEYVITERDYVYATNLATRPDERQWLLAATTLAVCFSGFVFGNELVRDLAIGTAVGGSLAYLTMRFILTPFIARRHYAKYKLIQKVQTLAVSSNGLTISSDGSTSKCKWDEMLKWRDDPEMLLVYVMPRMFYVIPKPAKSKIEALLRAHLGDPK